MGENWEYGDGGDRKMGKNWEYGDAVAKCRCGILGYGDREMWEHRDLGIGRLGNIGMW